MDTIKYGQYLLAISQLYELDTEFDLLDDKDPILERFIYENDAGVPLAVFIKLGYLDKDQLNDKCVNAIISAWAEANSLGLIDKYVAKED